MTPKSFSLTHTHTPHTPQWDVNVPWGGVCVSVRG